MVIQPEHLENGMKPQHGKQTHWALDRWPIHQGFDKFYGFLGGETNQWAPFVYDGVHPVELPDDPNYHFMT